MPSDIRDRPAFRAMLEYYRTIYEPGFGSVTYASEVATCPAHRMVAFTGTVMNAIDARPSSAIFTLDADSGAMRRVTAEIGDASAPRWSVDGARLAFLSDRGDGNSTQAYVLERGVLGEGIRSPRVDGVVEYLAWSPDGRQLLLGVAGAGAELSGMQGSTTTPSRPGAAPAWMPTLHEGFHAHEWRRVWVYDTQTGRVWPVTGEGRNVWDAAWFDDERICAVMSAQPDEAAWYTATLNVVDVRTGTERLVHTPRDQLSAPACPPGGGRMAVIEAVCSDRSLVAGDVLVGGPDGLRRISTEGVDVTHLAWRDGRRLLMIGLRDQHTVVVEHDIEQSRSRETWCSDEVHCGFWYPTVAPLGDEGCVFVAEGYLHPPTLVEARAGALRPLRRFTHAETDAHLAAGLYGDRVEAVSWEGPDGLEIQGTLILPPGEGPFPTIMEVHGGPIWMQRSRWMGAVRAEPQAFVHRGFAVFRPNPRGSAGRGQDYARRVVGDMGGKDTLDLLAGTDHLVRTGRADAARLGVMGVSYGGYMSSWLVTQDRRFRASIPISPVTDWVSMQWTSNVPHFVSTFLDSAPFKADGLFHARSPVKFADRVGTPTLIVAGSLDRISPPEQAVEFYRALRLCGAETALVVYPQEGHNVRNLPATIDASARYLEWFERHLRGA
jgi:dipeptidyl aminopeptidase/acylaminoacyl peptidase